jgi:hypothetical protein
MVINIVLSGIQKQKQTTNNWTSNSTHLFFPQGLKVDSFPRLYIEFGGKLKVHLFHLFSYHILVPFGGEFRSQEIVNKWN